MDLKQTEDEVEQLASVWEGAPAAPDTTQLEKADTSRNQQISQIQAQIDAEQRQVRANDQSAEAAEAKLAAIDLDIARLEGREEELEK